MSDVSDISDVELLGRAIRGCKPTFRRNRWAVVSDQFALGSTYSKQLCIRFDLDPYEVKPVKRKTRT